MYSKIFLECSWCKCRFMPMERHVKKLEPFWYDSKPVYGVTCPECLHFNELSTDMQQRLQLKLQSK